MTKDEFNIKYNYDIARACENCNFYYDAPHPKPGCYTPDICEKRPGDIKDKSVLSMCVCDLFEHINYNDKGRRLKMYGELFAEAEEAEA